MVEFEKPVNEVMKELEDEVDSYFIELKDLLIS